MDGKRITLYNQNWKNWLEVLVDHTKAPVMDKVDFIIKIPMTLPWLIWATDFTFSKILANRSGKAWPRRILHRPLKATRLRVFWPVFQNPFSNIKETRKHAAGQNFKQSHIDYKTRNVYYQIRNKHSV